MKKSLPHIQYSRLFSLYQKLYARLNKHFSTGRFKQFGKAQQYKLLNRIERLRVQLSRMEQGLKLGGLALVFGTAISVQQANAQTSPAFKVSTYTGGAGAQRNTSVAMDSEGDFVFTWDSYIEDGSIWGIFGQRYDKSGVAVGAEFAINTYTTNSQSNSSVAMDADGDFVVSWQSKGQDGDNYGVYAQCYDKTGAKVGNEFQVNTYTTNYQGLPSIAMDAAGDFVISWQSNSQDGSSYGIYAQRYNESGVKVGGEFQVNSYTTSSQAAPSAAMDNYGSFIISWGSGHDGSNYGIYAQRYDKSGAAIGNEFQVNTYTTNRQANPSAAMNADGDFMISWQSYGQDGSKYGVYAQRYDKTGTVVGSEFSVNSYTTNNQISPSAAMDAAGDFVISWESYGSSYGIYAQRYDKSGAVVGTNFLVNTSTQAQGSKNDPAVAMDAAGDFVIGFEYTSVVQNIDGIYACLYNAIPMPPTTGVLSGTNNTALVLYPNPAKTDVYMNLEGVTQVRLMDLSGKVLKYVTTGNSSFSVAGVSPGIYMVELTQNGEKAMSKLVIE
jgi:hypothetical protein